MFIVGSVSARGVFSIDTRCMGMVVTSGGAESQQRCEC